MGAASLADCTATFELGTNGNSIATGDAGSLTAWNIVDAPAPIYDNTHVAHGTLAAKCTTGDLAWTTAFGAQTDHYGRFYLYFTANPATRFAPLYTARPAGVDSRIYINTSGQVELQRGSILATSTVVVNLNGWTRIEYHLVQSSAGAGSFETKIFTSMDSITPAETIGATGLTNGVDTTEIYFGNATTTGGNAAFWIDDIVAAATSYPGPVVASGQQFLLNEDGTHLLNMETGLPMELETSA